MNRAFGQEKNTAEYMETPYKSRCQRLQSLVKFLRKRMSAGIEFSKPKFSKFFLKGKTCGPCCLHILARENAIKTWRTMMGPTKVFQAVHTHPDTIRGTHGLTDTRNATHGSDSQESAEREIKVFFPDFSTSDWYANEHEKFLKGFFEFNAAEFIHVCQKGS